MSDLDLSKLPHMDIVDMPSDPNGYLSGFRSTLRGVYNSNRSNPRAIALIKETLEYAVGVLKAAEVAPAPESPDNVEAPPAPEKQTSKATTKSKSSTRAAQR